MSPAKLPADIKAKTVPIKLQKSPELKPKIKIIDCTEKSVCKKILFWEVSEDWGKGIKNNLKIY